MINIRQILIISLIIVLILPATLSFSQQSKRRADIDFLSKELDHFLDYQQDFGAFVKTHQSDPFEVSVSFSLSTVATEVAEYILALRTLLMVFDVLSSKADRAATKPFIKDYIDLCIKQLGIYIEAVNEQISNTKVPAIAVSGTQMKEDMRKIKSRLESIELQ